MLLISFNNNYFWSLGSVLNSEICLNFWLLSELKDYTVLIERRPVLNGTVVPFSFIKSCFVACRPFKNLCSWCEFPVIFEVLWFLHSHAATTGSRTLKHRQCDVVYMLDDITCPDHSKISFINLVTPWCSWKAGDRSAYENVYCLLWKYEFYCPGHKSPPPVPILSQMN
jgi:hypothetical protein